MNNKIKDRPPSEYFAELRGDNIENLTFETALRSHLIPSGSDSPFWNDDYDAFLDQRTDLIWAEVLEAVGDGDIYNSGAPVPRDKARLAVDEIEVKLRRIVHQTLHLQSGPDYWKTHVPSDVQVAVKERINERHRSRVITKIEDPLIRLQYADIMDY